MSRAKEIFEKVKGKVEAFKKERSEKENFNAAKRLQKLKKDREYFEGKARLASLEEKERARIEKAKEKAPSFGKKLKKGLSKLDEYAKQLEKQNKGKPPLRF